MVGIRTTITEARIRYEAWGMSSKETGKAMTLEPNRTKKNANKKNVLTCVTRNKEGGTYGNCNSNGNKQRALLEGEQANLIVSCSRLQPHSSLSES